MHLYQPPWLLALGKLLRAQLVVTILALCVEDSVSLTLSKALEPTMGTQVPYVTKHLINEDVLWANHTCDA